MAKRTKTGRKATTARRITEAPSFGGIFTPYRAGVRIMTQRQRNASIAQAMRAMAERESQRRREEKALAAARTKAAIRRLRALARQPGAPLAPPPEEDELAGLMGGLQVDPRVDELADLMQRNLQISRVQASAAAESALAASSDTEAEAVVTALLGGPSRGLNFAYSQSGRGRKTHRKRRHH
jgi:hypothetical protein